MIKQQAKAPCLRITEQLSAVIMLAWLKRHRKSEDTVNLEILAAKIFSVSSTTDILANIYFSNLYADY